MNVDGSLVKNPPAAKCPHNRFPVGSRPPEPSPPKSGLRPVEDEKEHHPGEAAKRMEDDEKSTTGASTPRRTLSTLETNAHSKRAVINIVPTKASNAEFLRVMSEYECRWR